MERIKKSAPCGVLAAFAMHTFAAAATDADVPKPTPPQLAWQQAELGAVIHYDLHVFDGKRYNQRINRITPIDDHNIFDPEKLDTDQWARTLKDAGFTFAILTVSHETGFRLWQSDANPYSLKALAWGDGKRDIFREFVDSCRRHGIKPGVYMGTRWNSQLGVFDFKVTDRSTITQQAYNAMIEKEVAEICGNYGPLFQIWFDGGGYGPDAGGPDVLSIVEKLQPDIHFYHNHDRADSRWGGSETGTVPYPCWGTLPFKGISIDGERGELLNANNLYLYKHGDPDGAYWCPAMSDAPLRGKGGHEWFWGPDAERFIYPLDELFTMYLHSVGRNSTLIMGITPDPDGLIPEADAARLREFGAKIREVFGKPLAETDEQVIGTEVILETGGKPFDHIVMQEDIRQGERVREYVVEARVGETWNKIAEGSCIGHKRIHRLDSPVTAGKIRLRIGKSTATPIISRLAIHSGEYAK